MHVRVIASLGIALALHNTPPASAQWIGATRPSAAASRNCSIEWAARLAAGNPARPSMNGGLRLLAPYTEARVRGNGRFMRDFNYRGRDFSFDCTFNSRNNSARATDNWSGAGWGGQYPDPDPGYNRPPSGGYAPDGRVFFSGGIVSRLSGKCLDVEGRSTRNTANVQQWSCSGGPTSCGM